MCLTFFSGDCNEAKSRSSVEQKNEISMHIALDTETLLDSRINSLVVFSWDAPTIKNIEHCQLSNCVKSSKESFHVLCFVDVQGCQDSKLQAERIAALQERKQALEALLNSRVGELKQVCLQEAVSSSHFTFKTYKAPGAPSHSILTPNYYDNCSLLLRISQRITN